MTDDKRELGRKVFLAKDLPKLVDKEQESNYYFNQYVKEWIPLARSRRLKFEKNKEFIPSFDKVVQSFDANGAFGARDWSPEIVSKRV